MTITYTWEDIKIYGEREKYSQPLVCSVIDATLVGTHEDGSISKTKIRHGFCHDPDRDLEGYVNFDDLTLENIITWMESDLKSANQWDYYTSIIREDLDRWKIKSL